MSLTKRAMSAGLTAGLAIAAAGAMWVSTHASLIGRSAPATIHTMAREPQPGDDRGGRHDDSILLREAQPGDDRRGHDTILLRGQPEPGDDRGADPVDLF